MVFALFLGHTGAARAESVGFGCCEMTNVLGFCPEERIHLSLSDMVFALFLGHLEPQR